MTDPAPAGQPLRADPTPPPLGAPVAPAGPGATGGELAGQPRADRVVRPATGRVFAGVCSGIATHLGVPASWIRWVFVLGIPIGGAGLMAYALMWMFTPVDTASPAAGLTAEPQPGTSSSHALQLVILGVLIVIAALLFGLVERDWSDKLPSPFTLGGAASVAAGAYLAWTYLDDIEVRRARGAGRPPGWWGRLVPWVVPLAGVLLVVSGVLVLAASSQGIAVTWDVIVASASVLAGIAIVALPWGVRVWGRYVAERELRIREIERATIAAHLHDSVLQTLALIQRTDDAARAKVIARAQERELRTWLYGGAQQSSHSLAAAARLAAQEIEELHGVPIDVVVTGDRPLDEATEALVQALREALLNAVRHGQVPVSAYIEVGRRTVQAYVRDHGPGFDLADIPKDRLGVRGSIIGRMKRVGGDARCRRLDDGTEVELTLDVPDSGAPAGTKPADPATNPHPGTNSDPHMATKEPAS